MKVALVHDYLREYGGAERVLESLHRLFPDAPLYTAYYNPSSLGKFNEKFKGWEIKTSFIQRLPFANKLLSLYRVFAPSAFESFNFSEYDLVISSCNIYYSKAVITKPESLHISYIHSPPRYLYGYTTSFNYKKHWWTKLSAEFINHFLRLYDFETSQRPDILVANSKNVASRIRKFYRRDSVVIYPPVNVEEFRGSSINQNKDYFLSLSRLWKGKGVDTIVKAVLAADVPLKVVGTGPESNSLKKLAKNNPNIEFLGNVSDVEKVKLYQGAKALIVASEDEDFGITAIESQAAGTPVIAIRQGGYLESVVEGKTGEFFNDFEELVNLLKSFDVLKYKAADLKLQSEKFSEERFREDLLKLINTHTK